jgi:hypothetical protein
LLATVREGAVLEQCCSGYQCCNGDLSYLLLQINVICLLLALVGTTAIVKHPDWFGAMAAVSRSLAER